MVETVKTEFNSSVATLERIDTLLKMCRDAQYLGDYSSYFRHLRNLRKEALPKMKHKAKQNKCAEDCFRCRCDKLFAKIDNLDELYESNREDRVLSRQFSKKLDDFEVMLREFMDSKGMLMSDNRDEGL